MVALGVLAGALVLVACLSSSAAQSASGGVIHIYTAGTLASPLRPVVITGAFADVATINTNRKSKGNAVPFTKGSIKIDDSAAMAADAAVYAHLSKYVNPSTCALSYTYTAPLKLRGGMGAYAGISGTVTLHNTDEGVMPRLKSGKCNESENATPIGFLSESYGSGRISFK
jgi:hypothetical protein